MVMKRNSRFQYAGMEADASTGLNYDRARWYDPNGGKFIGQDPIGFAGGDANTYRYVGNDSPNQIDLTGWAGRPGRGEWRLDLHDHGGPHIQQDDSRWSAIDLQPIKHKGFTPLPLTQAQLCELGKNGILDKIIKNVQNSIVAELSQQLAQETLERGLRKLSKQAMKEVADILLRRAAGPLAILLAAYSVANGSSTCKQEIRNAILPADLIDSAVAGAQAIVDPYFADGNYNIEYKRFISAGYTPAEASQMAKDNFDSKKMK